LATHGYFLANHERDPNGDIRDLGALPSLQSGGFGRLVASRLEDPLLRSGLALAGVNQWLKGSSPPAEAEDGLLTAADVSGMNLQETDLVVLSACDTRRGTPVGASSMSLSWGFFYAGAPTVIASLWPVDDAATALLMGRFYENLLGADGAEPMDPGRALLAAKRWLQGADRHTVRAALRARGAAE
jgi:hypothetical protein